MRMYRSPSVLCVAKSNLKYANDGYTIKLGLTIGDLANTCLSCEESTLNKLSEAEFWNEDGHGKNSTLALPIEF